MSDDLSDAAKQMGKKSAKVRLEKYGVEQYSRLGKLSAKKRKFVKREKMTKKNP